MTEYSVTATSLLAVPEVSGSAVLVLRSTASGSVA